MEGASKSWKDDALLRYIPLENIFFIHSIARGKPIQVTKAISMRSFNARFTRSNFCSRGTLFILSLAEKPIWAFELYLTGNQQAISDSTKLPQVTYSSEYLLLLTLVRHSAHFFPSKMRIYVVRVEGVADTATKFKQEIYIDLEMKTLRLQIREIIFYQSWY